MFYIFQLKCLDEVLAVLKSLCMIKKIWVSRSSLDDDNIFGVLNYNCFFLPWIKFQFVGVKNQRVRRIWVPVCNKFKKFGLVDENLMRCCQKYNPTAAFFTFFGIMIIEKDPRTHSVTHKYMIRRGGAR